MTMINDKRQRSYRKTTSSSSKYNEMLLSEGCEPMWNGPFPTYNWIIARHSFGSSRIDADQRRNFRMVRVLVKTMALQSVTTVFLKRNRITCKDARP